MELRNRKTKKHEARGSPTSTAQVYPAGPAPGVLLDRPDLSSARRISLAIQQSPIGKLWLRSVRAPEKNGHIPVGFDRELTFTNFLISFQLLPLLCASTLSALRGPKGNAFVSFLARRVIVGLIPAATIWVQAQLMDTVQMGVSGGHVNGAQFALLVALNLLCSSFHDIYGYFAKITDANAECDMNEGLERAYMSAQMSLSIPSLGSEEVQALTHEASIFIGHQPYRHRSGNMTYAMGPFDHIRQLLDAVLGITRIISLTAILVRAISGSTAGPIRWAFVGLCIGPTFFRVFGGLFFSLTKTRTFRTYLARSELRSQEHWLQQLGQVGPYKQENVMFGLRDWELDRLAGVRREMRAGALEQMADKQAVNLYLAVGQNSIEAVFYVAMVSRVLGNSISLGTARLCQAVAGDLAQTLRGLGDDIERSFQAIFYLAAFVECSNLPHDLYAASDPARAVQYDSTRPASGGMGIIARNLSFSNINLNIPAGQTLAIVGFNGGGKTTLVKVLMGLFEHEGELLINGVSASSIDKQTLYGRTACLFQDYNMYPATLRENVGVGRLDKIDHRAAILRAMEWGRADAVVKELGSMEVLLGPHQRPGGSAMANPDDRDDEANDDADKTAADPQADGEAEPGATAGDNQLAGGKAQLEEDGTKNDIPDSGTELLSPEAEVKRKTEHRALSGGQWQRIALSRAVLRAEEADLVVFDEPSASLDPRAEAALFERIHKLSTSGTHKPTTIYISHRFSTGELADSLRARQWLMAVRKADQIAVVEDGTIVEVGSHTELMRLNGRYAELFKLQKEGYESD